MAVPTPGADQSMLASTVGDIAVCPWRTNTQNVSWAAVAGR